MTLVAEPERNTGKVQSETQAPFRIPWPEAKLDQRRWQLEQMAGAFRVFAKMGFADGGSGHISLRGNTFPSLCKNHQSLDNGVLSDGDFHRSG